MLRLRYMHSLEEGENGDNEALPARAEDVDKFMKDLAAAASGGSMTSSSEIPRAQE